MLALASCASASFGSWTPAVPLAACIECLTTAMDLFDDLEEGDLRTYNTLANPAQLTNAASALLMLGVSCLASSPCQPTALVAIRNISMAALAAADSQNEEAALLAPGVTLGQVLEMAAGKTARLASTVCETGALVGGAEGRLARRYAQFGFHVGIMAQLADDLVDFEEDLIHGRVSVPLVFYHRYVASCCEEQMAKDAAKQYAWLLARVHRHRAKRVLLRLERERPAFEYLSSFIGL